MILSALLRQPPQRRLFARCLSPATIRQSRSSSSSSQATSTARKPAQRSDWSKSDKGWEMAWYNYWYSNNFFKSQRNPDDFLVPLPPTSKEDRKPPIRMLLPPPNVTGQLHIGHALMLSIQDTLARYYRMCGHRVIWKPGTDHAGIATQSVVERMLAETEGVSRHDLGREKLVQKISEWRSKYGNRIVEQIKRMGISTDWSQTYYTLSPNLSEPVENAFVRLHDAGLIYRDTRMVNWSCGLGTAVSDVEVEWKTFDKRTFDQGIETGVLWNVTYKIVTETDIAASDNDTSQVITVATTRPETIWGDRAIAVHPDDERYKHLHYKYAQHPLLQNVRLPIIPDGILVDPKYGTGAVKITPAHDANDYAFWKRHSVSAPQSLTASSSSKKLEIPLILVFDNSGKMLPSCGREELVGLDRLKAREPTIALLREIGSLHSRIPNPGMRVGYCSRGGGVIEGVIQPQWYLATEKLANLVKTLTESENDGRGLSFTPDSAKYEWSRWLEGMRDWCLSRQIWWGHRIPAYRAVAPESSMTGEQSDSIWVSGATEDEARSKLSDDKRDWVLLRDEDVLDTWFSSGLLPLSTVGWRGLDPSVEPSYNDRYPLTFIESGGDILFFWLIRMAMLGSWFSSQAHPEASGRLPFKEIILHPLICDIKGRKMSKSEGNVIDPLAIIDGTINNSKLLAFPQQEPEPPIKDQSPAVHKKPNGLPSLTNGYGTDVLRWTLITYLEQTRQINFDTNQLDITQRLFTKLQNTYKYYHIAVKQVCPDGNFVPESEREIFTKFDPLDMYIRSHLDDTISAVHKAIRHRKLADATKALRVFLWNHLCDVYLEFAKCLLQSTKTEHAKKLQILSTLYNVLDAFARLAHPISPFITEELWQELSPGRRNSSESLMMMEFPVERSFKVFNSLPHSLSHLEAFDQTLSLLSILNRARSASPLSRRSSKKVYVSGELTGNKELLESIVSKWREPLEFISRVRIVRITEKSLNDHGSDEIASVEVTAINQTPGCE